jgi:cobalt-zinc-cadmium efflux system outer membrane protein
MLCPLGALLLLLSGCSSSPRESGFESVRELARQRGGYTVSLERDAQAGPAIRELLAQPLKADQAVQLGLLNNPQLQVTFEDLGIARADLVQAGLLRNPIFDASLRWTNSGAPNAEFSVTQGFMELLFISARKKIAAADLDATKARIGDEIQRTAAEIRKAFVTFQADQQRLDLRKQAIQSFEASNDLSQRLYDAGNISQLQLLNEKASLEQARADLDQAEIELVLTREQLITLLGLEDASVLKIAGRLPDLPDAEPAAAHLEDLALEQRLDLAAARGRIETASRTLKLAGATQYLTDAQIGVDTEREARGDRVTGPVFSIPIPLFDFGQGAIPKARSQFFQARKHYQALAVQVRSEVRGAHAQLVQSRLRADRFFRSLVPLRHQITEQAQLHYNGMYLGPLELLRDKQDEINTASDAIGALRDYWIARGSLERAVGTSIDRLPATRPSTLPAAATKPASTAPAEPHQHQHHHGA